MCGCYAWIMIVPSIKSNAMPLVFLDIAQVVFASVLINPIVNEGIAWSKVSVGILFSLTFWLLALNMKVE